ncbi:MAG: hypothetical protein AB8G05_21210 [Oligoflexales bacterium]
MLGFEKFKHFTLTTFMILLGCGTIVGNPKKPVDDTTQTNSNFAIPEINIDIPEEDVNTDSASLFLTDSDPYMDSSLFLAPRNLPRRKILLYSWVRRVNGVIKEINRISQKVNQISATLAPNSSQQIVFAGQGEQGRLSGKIDPVSTEDAFAYQAVLCDEGEIFAHLKWSADASKIEFTKDFSSAALNSTLRTDYRVNAMVEQGEVGLNLSINSQGTWVEELVEESKGTSLLEFGDINFGVDNIYEIKTVSHRYQDQLGAEVSGDSFLTGRLVPSKVNSDKYFSEFLAYLKSAETCGSFSEDQSTIWNFENLGDDGWCYGSPLGRNTFRNLDALQRTYTNLETIGFASSQNLEVVSFDAGLTCQ